jgi:hypothetical protein
MAPVVADWDLGRPRGRPCDWLVEADQDDQDDPLTVHRPARMLLPEEIFFRIRRRRISRATLADQAGRPLREQLVKRDDGRIEKPTLLLDVRSIHLMNNQLHCLKSSDSESDP